MADSSSGSAAEIKRHSAPVNFLIRLVKEKPLGAVGGIITLILLLTGILADFLPAYGTNEVHMEDIMVPPSVRYWLGTDNLGRDVLSRIIFGARISVIVGLGASTVITVLASIIGIMTGYIGGNFDLIVQRFVDALMSVPGLILMMVLISIIGPGMWQVIVVMGIRLGVTSSRVIRSAVIGIKEDTYVEAAAAVGCSTSRILTRHILPNIIAHAIVIFTTRMPTVIIVEASLSFLGFGIPPPTPSWGGMLSGSARAYMFKAPWMVIWPGVALAAVVYGINMFGDALRDLLDPRLRGGAGRYGLRE